MANERSREIFLMRAKVLAAIREHMNERDFVELETPILQRHDRRRRGAARSKPTTTRSTATSSCGSRPSST